MFKCKSAFILIRVPKRILKNIVDFDSYCGIKTELTSTLVHEYLALIVLIYTVVSRFVSTTVSCSGVKGSSKQEYMCVEQTDNV